MNKGWWGLLGGKADTMSTLKSIKTPRKNVFLPKFSVGKSKKIVQHKPF
jgi:hypothetical protein